MTAEPVIVLPEAAPVPAPTVAPAPVIVLPEAVAEPAPVVAEQAEPAPVARTTPRRATRAAVTPRTAAADPAPVAAASAVSTPVAETTAPVAVAAPALPVEAQPAPSEPVAASANDNATAEIAIAAMLGALGLAAVGGIAFMASRRRRRRALENEQYDEFAYEPVAEEEAIVEEPAILPEPVAARTVEPMPAPVFATAAPLASAFATPVVATAPVARATTQSSGDPIALPAGVPETFEERDALLKDLVAAEPDRANPFTGVRARARRAKLIMQSLGQDFRDRKPRIDLSEYTHRWPALRGWQPATA